MRAETSYRMRIDTPEDREARIVAMTAQHAAIQEQRDRAEAEFKASQPPKRVPMGLSRQEATVYRNRVRCEKVKARCGGLVGVVQKGNRWVARFTPPKGYGAANLLATVNTKEEAVEIRNGFVRKYYGDTRPWLFAEILTEC